jgi:GcrA cell cycle regulator
MSAGKISASLAVSGPDDVTLGNDFKIDDRDCTGRYTREILEEVARQRSGGRSFAQIALSINSQFGTAFSRNALLGKANRLGWGHSVGLGRVIPKNHHRPAVKRHKDTDSLYSMPSPRRPAKRPVKKPSKPADLSGFLEPGVLPEAKQCHWPEGEFIGKKDWRYCGAPTGSVAAAYCAPHQARMVDKKKMDRLGQARQARLSKPSWRRGQGGGE